ncbi:MAG: inositol monophosphatase family protein [Planctomycetota bacterium]|nr:inositol monophosphatase family protein [Planctomycetota bacterium]MDA1212590.1 inositol monophosphatase family protein [Planctomycetota bacterium]
MSFSEFLPTAKGAAQLAGEVLRSWAERFTITEKSPANLVTEADIAAQAAIYDFISKRYPDHNFLGEEGLNESHPNSTFRWVIDPLDGTSNYAHRFPYYAVSIGLECDGELVCGVIYDPTRDELFWTVKGDGAWLNDSRLSTSRNLTLDKAMLMASLPVAVRAHHPAVNRFLRAVGQAQTVQRSGSAALNLAYIAAGRLDGFWSTSLLPWDMAAGVLLVREAGGVVTQLDGGTFRLERPSLLAANGESLHREMVSMLS